MFVEKSSEVFVWCPFMICRVTDAKYWERIEKLFKKARGGEGEEIKSRYVPKNILGDYKI